MTSKTTITNSICNHNMQQFCDYTCNSDVLILQAHRLRTQSIALHRYFLNRKSNVHNGISLADAIETSVANVCKTLLV